MSQRVQFQSSWLAVSLTVAVSACSGQLGVDPDADDMGEAGKVANGGAGGARMGGAGQSGSPAAGSGGGVSPVAGAGGQGGDVAPSAGTTGNPDAGIGSDASITTDAKLVDPVIQPPAGSKRAFLAVGYGGIRALSVDDGKTWTKTGEVAANGGDDGNLLRSVAWGNGIWVAGGWNKWFTSPDGRTWTQRSHNFGIMQGMAFGSGFFLASEMNGSVFKSTDGIEWTRVGRANTGKHTELAFGNGTFAAWGQDTSTVETSRDGVTWVRDGALRSAAYCGGDAFKTQEGCYVTRSPGAWAPGVYVRSEWKGQLLRSVDGRTYMRVFSYPSNAFDAIAVGYVPE